MNSGPVARLVARSDVRLTLGLVLPLLVALYEMWHFHAYTVDDAFISFRYARNLIDGHGLVYNLGERVEGYTNLSWTLMIAGALAAGADPEWFTTVLGGAFGLGTIVVTYRVAERLLPASPVPCVATWLLATSPGASGHAVFGLETSMFTFLVIAGILAFLREEDDERRRPWSGLIFAVAGLTRPEAPLFFGLMMLHLGGRPLVGLVPLARLGRRVFGGQDHDWRGPALYVGVLAISLGVSLVQRDYWRDEASALTSGALLVAGAVLVVLTVPRSLFARRNLVRIELFLVPAVVHLMWRFKYYGRWLPNTLTAKTGDSGVQFVDGTRYFDYYIGDVEGPLVWFVFAACGLAIAKREPVRLAFASMVAAFCSYVMLVGGDWMILGRFFVPLLPMFYLLLGLTACELLGMRRATMWGVILAVPFVVYQRGAALEESRKVVANERDYWNDCAGGTAKWFVDQEREHGEAARGTIALGDIGRVGWETGFPIFDVLGLVDQTTAEASGGHRHKTGDDFLDHFFEVAPRYYVSATATARCYEEVGPPVLRAIQRDPRFQATYRVRARIHGEARKNLSWCIFELSDHDSGRR
jgi:hypothetical protein